MVKVGASLVALALGLALATLASATPDKDAYRLTASLGPRFEVPRPRGVPAGAAGTFTGTVVELANDRARLTWRLTFSKLSGRALQAHVHVGKPGTSGNVLAALCAPCRSGQRGTVTITHAQLRTLRRGGAYVNVHTARNAAGEIRGQITSSKTAASGGDSSGTTTTTTEPPPYP